MPEKGERCPTHSGQDAGGRPPHQPDETKAQIIKALAKVGIPQKDIAEEVDLAPATIRKHYRRELDLGKQAATAQVIETAWRMAVSGQAWPATKWWLSVVLNLRETEEHTHEHSLSGGDIDALLGLDVDSDM